MGLDEIHEQLAELHRGRKWVVTAEVAAGVTELIKQMATWDVADVMVLSANEGVGELPEDVPIHYTRSRGATMMKSFRAFFATVREPSPDLIAALDDFDRERQALVMAPPFGEIGDAVAGRPVYGARKREWAALEDKVVVDELWDSAGVRRAPSEIVPVDHAPLAASRLAGPLGTVWTADNTEGWHGGGDYTRWVSGPDRYLEMVAWFAAHAAHVRVMPFLDGIPCSIHGFIATDGIATFRPVEIVILRRRDREGLVYGSISTLWDPPDEVRHEMRAVARAVSTELDHRVGYRGPFGIDGICTAQGFRPTELNPRLSAGLGVQARSAEVPLGAITRCLLAGELEVAAVPLEEVIIKGADATRIAGMGIPLPIEIESASTSIRFDGSKAESTEDEDNADGTLEVGPASFGSYLRMRLDVERISSGQSVAPYAVSAAALASELWAFDLPELEPAPNVCEPS